MHAFVAAGEWAVSGLCAQTDPEAFFPDKGGSPREAKKICQGCDVAVQCLQEALDTRQEFGVWGGMSERERRELLREGVRADEALAGRRSASA